MAKILATVVKMYRAGTIFGMESLYNSQNMSTYLPKAVNQLAASTSKYKGFADLVAKSKDDPQQLLDFIKKMKT